MKLLACHSIHRRKLVAGFTLVEMLTSIALGLVLLVGAAILYINGNECFIAMANYQNLDAKSSTALDILSREVRSATAVTAYQAGQSITLTNATLGKSIKITYNSSAGTLILTETGQSAVTNLTGCDSWSFSVFSRVPNISATNITFYAATNAASTKLIQMNWTCSRTILGAKLITESVQTAQIVLRNKVK